MAYLSKSETTENSLTKNSNRGRTFHHGRSVLVLVDFWQAAPTVFIAITCLYILLIITGIVLNTLVCYVMIKSKRYLKNISCFFITHMAAVDLFCRVVLIPVVVYMSLPTKAVQSPIPCKISTFVSNSCAGAIFGSLVVIAIDRYRNIVHPLRSLKKEKRPLFVVSLVWFYAIASSVMFLHTAQNVTLEKLPEGRNMKLVGNPTSCNISPDDYIGSISVTISAIMTFFVPLTILIITYTAIFVSLRRRCQRQLIHNAVAKAKGKAARMLVLVVVGFVLCFGPSVVVQLLRSYEVFAGENNQRPTMVIVVLVTDTLEFCSSLFNPLIYTFFSEDFRKDLLNICNAAKIRRKMHFCNRKVCDPRASPRATGSTPVTS
ncbi:neuropeptide FF receptor 2-like [Actinia tenebrosa]|uniref:Neuropeptide FF receptor 2-like n=1 Tax=Actinia tenebrosa TaxID=6105 RepID=A0A6P8I7M9_ACTTE|nr:neuropeptide FF receptor 2-like [Actinia tenebrosa]